MVIHAEERTFFLHPRGSVFVAGIRMAVGFGAGELFEEIGVLDRGGDLVVAAGPFAEVEQTAAVRAEGEVLVGS